MGDYQSRSVGLRTMEQGYLHPGMDHSRDLHLDDAASSRAESQESRGVLHLDEVPNTLLSVHSPHLRDTRITTHTSALLQLKELV